MDGREKKALRIGIYTGNGASHSWLWFVEVFERNEIFNIDFIDSESIINEDLHKFNVLVFSGGDTFSIAESVTEKGAEKLKEFISSGGLYIGSCAGAYFPLNFDFPPLNYFNLVNADVGNFAINPPEPVMLSEKFSCPYGNGFVFHPLREDIVLDFNDETITAPLYGGPAFILKDHTMCFARYHSFTQKTLFLCDKKYAEEIYLNKPAVIVKASGNGFIVLTGPHLEHPSYKAANNKLLELIYKHLRSWTSDCNIPPYASYGRGISITELKKIVSNLRIMAEGLAIKQFKWKVGRKIYETEKIEYFIDFVWKRLKLLESLQFPSDTSFQELLDSFAVTKQLLKKLSDDSANENFEKLLVAIKESTTKFITLYLYNKRLSGEKIYA